MDSGASAANSGPSRLPAFSSMEATELTAEMHNTESLLGSARDRFHRICNRFKKEDSSLDDRRTMLDRVSSSYSESMALNDKLLAVLAAVLRKGEEREGTKTRMATEDLQVFKNAVVSWKNAQAADFDLMTDIEIMIPRTEAKPAVTEASVLPATQMLSSSEHCQSSTILQLFCSR